MIRVLQSIGTLGYTGIAAAVMNYYRHIDRAQVQFDFVTCSPTEERFDKEVLSLGGRIFRVPSRSRHPFAYFRALKKIIRQENYDVVHVHRDSASMAVDASAAKRCGVPVIIGHSHSTGSDVPWQHYLLRPFVNHLVTDRLACSAEAGQWVFGKKKTVQIVRNAIDPEEFYFRPDVRASYRAALGIEESHCIGFVGRLSQGKNVLRLLDIFALVAQKEPKAVLLLIGRGSMHDQIKERAEAYGISDKVLLLGQRNDVGSLMSAMDVFAFPSLFEGLGIVAIEAQTAGLRCVLSTAVPAPNFSGLAEYIELQAENEEWAEKMLPSSAEDREAVRSLFPDSGYDIKKEAQTMLQYYVNCQERAWEKRKKHKENK